jgi:hypothetical protein
MGAESDAGQRLYAALLAYLEAEERGEPPDLDALAADLADRPDLARQLREFALAHALVEELTDALRRAVRTLAPARPGLLFACGRTASALPGQGPGRGPATRRVTASRNHLGHRFSPYRGSDR